MFSPATFPNGFFGPKNLSPPWGPIALRGVLSPGSGRRMTLEQVFQTAQNLFPGISLEEVWAALRKDMIVGKVSPSVCCIKREYCWWSLRLGRYYPGFTSGYRGSKPKAGAMKNEAKGLLDDDYFHGALRGQWGKLYGVWEVDSIS